MLNVVPACVERNKEVVHSLLFLNENLYCCPGLESELEILDNLNAHM